MTNGTEEGRGPRLALVEPGVNVKKKPLGRRGKRGDLPVAQATGEPLVLFGGGRERGAYTALPSALVAEADAVGNHDLQYYYEHCWVLLAPMGSGGGTRNKFLEGMTFGIPVITNPQGGMGNIKIKNFQEAIVCPNRDILRHLFDLFDHPETRQAIGQAARRLIEKDYAFNNCVAKLNKIYDQITR